MQVLYLIILWSINETNLDVKNLETPGKTGRVDRYGLGIELAWEPEELVDIVKYRIFIHTQSPVQTT